MGLTEEEKRLASKVENKLKSELSGGNIDSTDLDFGDDDTVISKEYDDFKKENMPKEFGLYEKACEFSVGLMKASPDKEIKPKLEESIKTCHLNVTPESASSFTYIGAIGVFLICLVIGGVVFSLMSISSNPGTVNDAPDFLMFSMFIGIIMAMMAFFQIRMLPVNLASQWRMRASNSMIICVFYIVTYMRHTSNLENAIRFASEHVGFPLSLDLKMILWKVETNEFSNITESINDYLEGWKEYTPEFVESMHLIESSLLQGNEERRLQTLDKSLSNILEQTYEKMLHYAHNLQGPLSNLNMLGVILPVLGMVMLPLVVSMMDVQWFYLMGLYNIILFVAVFNLGNKILMTRPNGYGDTSEGSSDLEQMKKLKLNLGFTTLEIKPSHAAITVSVILFIIALSPILIYNYNPMFDEMIIESVSRSFPALERTIRDIKPLDYRLSGGVRTGPYGMLATLASFFFTLSAGIGLSIYFKAQSSNIIKIREKTKKLEEEFTGSLFQLSNRLEDGLPVEIALGKLAETLDGSNSGEFFKQASDNVTRLGMSVEEAIFNKTNGAIKNFPSSLVASTMKVLIESARKGPSIAAQAMANVSTYIKEIHKVDERLKDLMSETLSSMKSQIKMLTPLISAIVVGITSLIIQILGNISAQAAEAGDVGGAASMFGEGIPTYFFQIVVGLYVVQIVYLLTKIVSGIENGSDRASENYQQGVNLAKSTMIYIAVATMAVVAFTFLAITIMRD